MSIYILNAINRKKKQKKLVKKLEKEEVKRKWLASLLANKKTVALQLNFLKTTEIRGKKRVREKKMEWK